MAANLPVLIALLLGFAVGWKAGSQWIKRKAWPFVSNCSLSAHQKALKILRP